MAILFFFQNDRKYNQILETELNLNNLEKLIIEDEIKMYDQDKNCHKLGERVVEETTCEGLFKS